ncbi:MAG: Amidohydrolase [Pedosphaera sp.]|nr:Amidohydrolase [Pedosphaera sp.]
MTGTSVIAGMMKNNSNIDRAPCLSSASHLARPKVIARRLSPLFGLFLLLFLFTAVTTASAESVLLQHAIVHTVSGETLPHGSVLIQSGKIVGVFDETQPTRITYPADATLVDLQGQHLYPGIIALNSALGLGEIDAVRATQDTTEVGDYRPDVQSWIAVNPDSELIPVTRANGITHAEPAPQGGVVGGLSALIALDGWTTEQMTIKHPVALHLYWPSMELNTTPKEKFKDESKYKSLEDQAKERKAKFKALDDFFLEARAYARARTAGNSDINPPWEAMLPVARGQIPIMVHAHDVREIKAAVKWAQTNDYKIILAGGRDAWQVADLLAARQIPVIYESTWTLPQHDHEAYDVHFRAPELLRKAGVKVVFGNGSGSFDAAMAKNLPYAAAQAVAFGLPESEALKGLTLYPAQLLGVADRLGSIEPGKEATFFVADGDILDLRVNVKRMWIAGHEVSLESRHTRLYEKYKNRPRPK